MTLFKGKIKKRYLHSFLHGISTMVDECKLDIQPDGIYVKEVDPGNVCMVDAKLPEQNFEQGSYWIKKPIVVGIDLLNYLQIFTDDDFDDDIFELNLLEPVGEDTPKLNTMVCKNVLENVRCKVRYEHTTLKIESIRRSPKIPNIDLPLEITIPLEFLKHGINAVDHVDSDHMYIGVNFNTGPMLFMKNHDGGNIAGIKITVNHLPGFKYNNFNKNVYNNFDKNTCLVRYKEIKTLFSLDYLKDILKGLSKYGYNDNITLHLGTDCPVIISTNFGVKGPDLKFMLAPRIQDD
ncbi:MAG: hypothetical protein KAS66_09475 [Candidatus Omnitrophica bacterium]|nr:hypothetical protein [Candidatus Omnitrophota bacterium]